MRIENDLLPQNYTYIEHEDEFKFNAPNHFKIFDNEDGPALLAEIEMQERPIKEHGVNGCHNEDLIAIVLTRLEAFQNSEFKCRENECAIIKLEEALMWLRKRTVGREYRGVEGTHIV